MLAGFSKVGVVVICLLLVTVTLAGAGTTYPTSTGATLTASGTFTTCPH